MTSHMETCIVSHLQLLAQYIINISQQAQPPENLTRLSEVTRALSCPNCYHGSDNRLQPVNIEYIQDVHQCTLHRQYGSIISTTDTGFHSSPGLPLSSQSSIFSTSRWSAVNIPQGETYHHHGTSGRKSETPQLQLTSAEDLSAIGHPLNRLMQQTINTLEQKIVTHSEKISILEKETEDIIARQCHGTYIWRIKEVKKNIASAKNGLATALHSPGFYTSPFGYKICIRINLNGIEKGFNKHLSLFIHFMKGDYDDAIPWPFRGKIILSIIDQSDPMTSTYTESLDANPEFAAFQKPTSQRNNKGFGYIEFAPLSVLDNCKYVKNDILFVKAIVRVADSI